MKLFFMISFVKHKILLCNLTCEIGKDAVRIGITGK